MATYIELHKMMGAPETGDFRSKVRIAILGKALLIAESEISTETEITWAKLALRSPSEVLKQVFLYVIIDNAQLTVNQIQNATDAQIQTSVNNSVDTLLSR